MGSFEDDEIPLLLVERRPPRWSYGRDAAPSSPVLARPSRLASLEKTDRMGPGWAGAVAGTFAGVTAACVIQQLEPTTLERWVGRLAAMGWADHALSLPILLAALAIAGLLVGALFARLTRRLRKFLPVLLWAVVFFPCLGLLAQAAVATYVHGRGLSPITLLAASAAYGFVVAFQLPLRARKPQVLDAED